MCTVRALSIPTRKSKTAQHCPQFALLLHITVVIERASRRDADTPCCAIRDGPAEPSALIGGEGGGGREGGGGQRTLKPERRCGPMLGLTWCGSETCLSVWLYVGGVFLHVAPCGGRGGEGGLGA